MGKKTVHFSIFLFTLGLVFSFGVWLVSPIQALNPPPAPPLGIPANGATNVSENPAFDWDGVGNTDGYWIFLSPASAPTWYWYKITTSSNASWSNGSGWSAYGGAPNPPSTLSSDTKYIWAVVAYNSAGQTSSSVWQFTVRTPAAPTPTPTPKPKATPTPPPGATPPPATPPPPSPSPDDIISIAGMLNKPTDLTAELTDTNSVELCWNDNSEDETHWFVAHIRPLPQGGDEWHYRIIDPPQVLDVDVHEQLNGTRGTGLRCPGFTEDDLSDGTHYFWVGGYNNDTKHWSDWSNYAELIIFAPSPPVSHTDPSGWPTTGEIRNWYPDLGGHPCDYDYCQNYRDVDIHNELGTPIYATMDGTVFYFGGPNDPLCGIGIIIQNDTNYVYYCHLATQIVPHGSQVTFRSTQIGTMGSTGNANSSHVHYGIQKPAPAYPFEPYWGARIDDLDDTDPN